jgi:hypothetical protein
MAKAEISWKRVTAEGQTLQCYAQHVGNRWIFFRRQKRFDRWLEVKEPPVEDWLALLDSVRRRINRRLLRPEEEGRLRKIIAERFPGPATGERQDRSDDGKDCQT